MMSHAQADVTAREQVPMEISVVIPCLNAASTIGVQLAALARQEWTGDWEAIVADNGSTDGSQEVVERFRSRFVELTLVDASSRRGASHAYNVGARAARGDLLLFCDADDEVAPGWLAAMAHALGEARFVGGRFDATRLNPPWLGAARPVPQQCGVQAGFSPLFLPHVGSGNMGIHASLFDEVEGFRESLPVLGDTDLCWRVQQAGEELRFVPDALLHVRLRPGVRSTYRQAVSYGDAEVRLLVLHQTVPLTSIQLTGSLIRKCLLTWGPFVVYQAARPRRGWLFHGAWELGWRVGRARAWLGNRRALTGTGQPAANQPFTRDRG